MKESVSLYSFPDGYDIALAVDAAAKVGYEGIEPVIGTKGLLRYDSTPEELKSIVKATSDSGLEISGLGARDQWKYNLVSNDPDIRAAAADRLKRQLEIAAELGTDTILASPGYVGYDFLPDEQTVRYDLAYRRSQDQLSALAKTAERLGVRIAIENVWNYFLLSPIEMNSFLDSIGSKFVGMYFDVGNCLRHGYPDQWIELLTQRIFRIHLCDFKRAGSGMEGFCDLLSGDVNYDLVGQAIKNIGYKDWLTLEVLPNYPKNPEIAVYANKPALDMIRKLCR